MIVCAIPHFLILPIELDRCVKWGLPKFEQVDIVSHVGGKVGLGFKQRVESYSTFDC
jgi:hypothetical protein